MFKSIYRKVLPMMAMLIAATVSAQTPVEDILGPWDFDVAVGGQTMKMRLVIGQELGQLTAVVESPQGPQEAENVKYKDGEFSLMIKFGPQPLELSVDIEGDTFSGKSTTPFGDIELSGRKISDDAIAEELKKFEAILGDWAVYTEYNGDDVESGMRFQIVGSELVGTVDLPGLDARLGRIKLKGDTLTWAVPLPFVSDQPARGKVTLDGEGKFTGTLTTSLGDIELYGELIDTTKLSASPYDDPTPILGEWEITAEMDGQSIPVTARIFENGERLAAVIVADGQEMLSTQVNWKEISETMGVIQLHLNDPEGGEDLHFELIVDGATFEGEEISGRLPYEFLISGKKL